MSLFISESIDGQIILKTQQVHSLQHYSAIAIIQHVKTLYDETLDKYELELLRFFSQFLSEPSSSSDKTSHYSLPSNISNMLFQLLLDSQLPPPLILTLAPYFLNSLTKLCLHVLPTQEVLSGVKSSNLTTLDFSNNISIDNSLFSLLSSSILTSSVKHINLSGCTKFINIQILSTFPCLQSLDLSKNYNLIFQFPQCMLCSLITILTALTRLLALDLHMTNFIPEYLQCEEWIEPHTHTPVIESCQLQLLNLYTLPNQSVHGSKACLDFYEFLLGMKYLDYLDISGWPFLNDFSKEKIISLSNGKSFFGAFLTGLMEVSLPLLSQETSGFTNEEQVLSSLQHYFSEIPYMEKLLFGLAHLLIEKKFALTTGSINVFAEYLYKTMMYYFRKNPHGSNYLINSLSCLASVLSDPAMDLPTELTQQLIELYALILHNVNVDDLRNNVVYIHTIQNCLINVEKVMHLDVFHFKLRATHHIFHKLSTDIIEKGTSMLKGGIIDSDFFELLEHTFGFLKAIFLKSESYSETLFGFRYKGIDVLMQYVGVKLELDQLDENVSEACGALMNATYLCYPNCLIVSSEQNSHTLCRVVEKNSEVECIMGILENVAEFCFQFESAFVVFNILPALKAILTTSSKRSTDTLACSIATLIYVAAGKEKWGWQDGMSGIDSLLNTAEETIPTMNYREKRFVAYSTLEYLFQCLYATDHRIHHCALWLLANLMFSNLDLYYGMVNQDAINKIRSFVATHTKSSPARALAEAILDLYNIGSYISH